MLETTSSPTHMFYTIWSLNNYTKIKMLGFADAIIVADHFYIIHYMIQISL